MSLLKDLLTRTLDDIGSGELPLRFTCPVLRVTSIEERVVRGTFDDQRRVDASAARFGGVPSRRLGKHGKSIGEFLPDGATD
jgi:hypothetical protein